jgi:AraC family transcriptional regulator
VPPQTVPPQTVPGIRKKGHYRQVAKLLPEIAIYAMEKGIPLTGHPVFFCQECSKEEAMNADREGSADREVAVPVPQGSRPGPGMNAYTLPGCRMARTILLAPCEAYEPQLPESVLPG